MKKIITAFTFLLLLSSACSNDTLPQYDIIQGMRVLALVLDQPEVNFDGTTFTPSTVNLTPWISDLYGNGRALSFNIYGCVDPGIGNGATPTCAGNSSFFQVVQNQTVVNTATFLAPNFTGAMSPIAIPLSGITPPAQNPITVYNGAAILIFFELFPTASPAQKLTTFKRLIFSGNVKTAKNQNPAGLQVLNGTTEITTFPTTLTDLNAFVQADQAETYFAYDTSGNLTSQTEELESAWFLTGPADIPCSKKKECTPDGYLNLLRSKPGELNTFNPPQVALPVGRGRVMVVVAKDTRGGSVVKRYCDGVCP